MTKSRFVLMKHQALKAGLHWDIRFKIPNENEWDSFASRKEPLLKSNEKLMITRTSIHSEKEALLLGKIESGYGAGVLTKDDSGSCDIFVYEPGKKMAIRFNGSKLKGIYYFINLAHIKKGDKNQYWFFKGKLP